MRVLDARGIAYRAIEYDSSGEFHSGDEAAALLGVPAHTVYKTLAVMREAGGKPMLVMIPVAATLDLKALARATGDKRLRMATLREAEALTGMQAGGISALGLKRPAAFDIYLDESARSLDRIHISAGARGIDLELGVDDLRSVTGCSFARASAAD